MSSENKLLIWALVTSGVAYLLPLYIGNIWLGYSLLLLVAVLYLASLIRFAGLNLKARSSRYIVMGIAGTLVVGQVLAFAHDYSRKNYQKNILLEIRKKIDTGIAKSDVQKELTYLFAQYHQEDRTSIVETARDLIPEKLGENGVYISDFDLDKKNMEEDDNANFFYEMDEAADELTVFVVSDVPLGDDPDFENYDEQTGRYEMKFTLSDEGVEYEVRN
jgi:hypothetical protein